MLEFGPQRGGDDDVGAALLHGRGCRGPFGGSGVGGGVPEGREEVGDVVYGVGGVRVEVAGEGRLGPGVGEQVGWVVSCWRRDGGRKMDEPFSHRWRRRLPSLPFWSASRRSRLSRRGSFRVGVAGEGIVREGGGVSSRGMEIVTCWFWVGGERVMPWREAVVSSVQDSMLMGWVAWDGGKGAPLGRRWKAIVRGLLLGGVREMRGKE